MDKAYPPGRKVTVGRGAAKVHKQNAEKLREELEELLALSPLSLSSVRSLYAEKVEALRRESDRASERLRELEAKQPDPSATAPDVPSSERDRQLAEAELAAARVVVEETRSKLAIYSARLEKLQARAL